MFIIGKLVKNTYISNFKYFIQLTYINNGGAKQDMSNSMAPVLGSVTIKVLCQLSLVSNAMLSLGTLLCITSMLMGFSLRISR